MEIPAAIADFLKKAPGIVKPFPKIISGATRIKTKLIAAFLVPIVLLIVQGIISFTNTSNTAAEQAVKASEAAVENSGKYLDVIFETVENLGGQIFADVDIQDYLSLNFDQEDIMAKAALSRKVENKLLNIAAFSPDVSNIILIPEDESLMAITSNVSTYFKLGDLAESQNMKTLLASSKSSGAWFGRHPEIDQSLSTSDMVYSVSYMRLIRSTTTMETVGLVAIDLKNDVINELCSGIKLADNQQIHLVTSDGRIFTNGIDASETSTITKQQFYKDIISSQNTVGNRHVKFEGMNYLLTYYKSGAYSLLALIPESELNSGGRRIIISTILIVALAVIIAFCTGIFIANSMSRTINRIINASGRAASGDLTVTLQSRRKDELGILTRSINSMIANMKSLIKQTIDLSDNVSKSASTVSYTSQQVTNVSQEISRAIQEITQGASAQAMDAEQGVQKISILAENINRVTENARTIDQLTKDTKILTRNGLASVEDLDVKANRTTIIAKEIMEDIKSLDVHSKSIGKIVKVISNIADQTNLLALNAAIEAARAGDAGKGFSVVADEVRKLAEQSMQSTREIANIIKSTQDQTEKAVEKAAVTESILRSQNEAVVNTIDTFKRIMDSMEVLSVQVEQIMLSISDMESNKAAAINSIQNISAVSQETAASSQEVTASTEEQLSSIEELAHFADELKVASEKLQETIAKFKL